MLFAVRSAGYARRNEKAPPGGLTVQQRLLQIRGPLEYLNISSEAVFGASLHSPICVETLILRSVNINAGNFELFLKFLLSFTGVAVLILDSNFIDGTLLERLLHYLSHTHVCRKAFKLSVRWNQVTHEDRERLAQTYRVPIDHVCSRRPRPTYRVHIGGHLPEIPLPGANLEILQRLEYWKPEILRVAQRILGKILGDDIDPRALVLSPYGSLVNGFYIKESSDVDLCFYLKTDLLPDRFKRQTPKQQKTMSKDFVERFGQAVRREWRCKAEVVPWGKVPLVKIFNWEGFRELNIILGPRLGMYNSQLLFWYAKDDLTLYYVGMQVKAWAKRNGLVNKPENHHSYISAYAWILMVIFFFQVCVRSTHSIQMAAERKPVACWGSDMLVEIESSDAILEDKGCDAATACDGEATLTEFFLFYAFDFDWSKMTVDIKDPERGIRERYFDTRENGDKFAAIRDPYERDRNLARGLNEDAFFRIIDCLQDRASVTR
jgi:hypothetical protein